MTVDEVDCAVCHPHTSACTWHWGQPCTTCTTLDPSARCGDCVTAEEA